MFRRSDGKGLGALSGRSIGGVYAILTPDSDLVFGHGSQTGWLSLHGGHPGDRIASVSKATRIVVAGATAYLHQRDELSALDRPRYFAMQRRRAELRDEQRKIGDRLKKLGKKADTEEGQKLKARLEAVKAEIDKTQKAIPDCFRWRVACPRPQALILAGGVLIAGGNGEVAAFSAGNGKETWRTSIDGEAHGLAVASGRLFVSTDTGAIYCFGAE